MCNPRQQIGPVRWLTCTQVVARCEVLPGRQGTILTVPQQEGSAEICGCTPDNGPALSPIHGPAICDILAIGGTLGAIIGLRFQKDLEALLLCINASICCSRSVPSTSFVELVFHFCPANYSLMSRCKREVMTVRSGWPIFRMEWRLWPTG